MYDVEMVGKTGHCCHVFIMANDAHRAAKLAEQYFPELELTGNTTGTAEMPADLLNGTIDGQDATRP